jgi:hypothetical protein
MPLKPSYLLIAGGGAIIAYSGLKGKNIGSAFRDVLGGHSPATALNANAIKGVGPSIPGLGIGGGPGVQSKAGASERSYFAAVLRDLGAPVTAANLTTMYTWAKHEEPSFPPPNAWNPLNIKNPSSGQFWQWGSPSQGAQGTANFMLQNNYSGIVRALRSGRGLIGNRDPVVASELSAWSGGGYSSL